MFIVLAVSLFTVRVVINTLDVVDYGLYSAVGGVVLTLSFISGVLAVASQRFFSLELGKNNYDRLSSIFGTMLFTYIVVALLVILFIETVGVWFLCNKMTIPEERFDAALVVLQFSLASFVVSIITNPFQALIIAHEDMSIYAYVSIIDVIIRLAIVYLLVVFPVDKLMLYAGLLFAASIISNGIYVTYSIVKYKKIKVRVSFNKSLFKSIFSFSSWTLLGTVAYMFNTQGINILLNMFFGPVVNAAYSVGNQVKTHVNQFSSNFYSAMRPPMIKSYAAGEYDYMNKLFYLSSKIIFALLFVIILPLSIETDNLLVLWLGEEKPYMVVFVRLMLIYGLICSLGDPITTIIQAAGRVKLYHGTVDVFTLLTLPIAYILFKNGSNPQWAFYISIIIFVFAHCLRLIILKGTVPFSIKEYINKIVLPILLCILIGCAYSVVLKFSFGNSLIATLTVCTITVILTIMLEAFVLFDKIERNKVLEMIKSKINK